MKQDCRRRHAGAAHADRRAGADNLDHSSVDASNGRASPIILCHGRRHRTGTPGGVGDSRTPPRYLVDGDVVEVWVDGVGTLRNPVRLERI